MHVYQLHYTYMYDLFCFNCMYMQLQERLKALQEERDSFEQRMEVQMHLHGCTLYWIFRNDVMMMSFLLCDTGGTEGTSRHTG